MTGGYYPSSLSPFLSSPSACSLSLLVLKSIPWAVIRVSSFSLWKLELLPLLIGGRTGSEYRPNPDFPVRFHSSYHPSKIHSCANVWDVKVEDYFKVNLEIRTPKEPHVNKKQAGAENRKMRGMSSQSPPLVPLSSIGEKERKGSERGGGKKEKKESDTSTPSPSLPSTRPNRSLTTTVRERSSWKNCLQSKDHAHLAR